MEEKKPQQPIPDILTLVSKEKFRRKLLIATRLIAIFLVCAILWIGYLQITYVKGINAIKSEYGPLAYCYLCGYENLRKCSCQYRPDIEREMGFFNLTRIQEETALGNTLPCPVMEKNMSISINDLISDNYTGQHNSNFIATHYKKQ